MRRWYRYESGNEKLINDFRKYLIRSGVQFRVETDKTKNCDWWVVQILARDEHEVTDINRWLNTH